jgi:hypothetical protein
MKQFNVASVKSVIRNTLLVSFLTISSVLTVSAKSTPINKDLATVNYIGSVDDQLSFLMNYENKSGEKFVVSILDSRGESLFEGVFSDKKFSRIFKVPSEAGNTTFVISDFKNKNEKKSIACMICCSMPKCKQTKKMEDTN